MAQAKSSTQRSLQDILQQAKNIEEGSINGLSYLENGYPEKTEVKAAEPKKTEKPAKAEKPAAEKAPAKKPAKKAETAKAAPKTSKAAEKKVEAEAPKAVARLIAPKKDLKNVKVGFIITEKAKMNLTRYTEMYEFRSANDFINELLENLDAYFGAEE